MPDLDLFGKTELWVTGITLRGVVLPDLAAAAASALDRPLSEVFVTDVRGGRVVFDILSESIALEHVAGRQLQLLTALKAVRGVTMSPDAGAHSRGVLGVIGTAPAETKELLSRADEIDDRLRAHIARRVAVVSTGAEVERGDIADTNLACVTSHFASAGFSVSSGGVADDDESAIAGRVARLITEGFGVIVTTGGVGAEDKDRTIEALELIVPELHTAVLTSYEVGHGRHVKPAVRVAAGRIHDALVVALPGPTREVDAAMPALLASIRTGRPAAIIVERMAVPIRALWNVNRSQDPRH
jgi:molybdenum cofactor synthesis domain-containing protein